MIQETHILFPPFHFDPVTERLWRGAEAIPLRPKTLAVLRYLVERPGQLVTPQELLRMVWSGVYVGQSMPRLCIREIRAALGDDAKQPRFIETRPRRGYRWIAPLTTSSRPVARRASRVARQLAEVKSPSSTPYTLHPTPYLVGREAELAQLHGWFEKARSGERQIVFVTGEPGIGKTTLVEAFFQSLESRVQSLASGNQNIPLSTVQTPDTRHQTPDARLWRAKGQCIEHYGPGEAYLPLLEALERLCRLQEGEQIIALLRRYAPTWLAQLPALLTPTEQEELQRQLLNTTQERMLREIAQALEALTAERSLVLWLEDLHWSDPSTLDLLSYLARRLERTQLMVLGTYRPADVLARAHPLRVVKQELQLHGHCQELALRLLTEAEVAEYLTARFTAQIPVPVQDLGTLIHRRTEGNPLFMVNVVAEFVAQGLLKTSDSGEMRSPAPLQSLEEIQIGVPATIQQMIELQFDRLSAADQQVLEVASVAGAEFSAAAVAAGIGTAVAEVEVQCAGLARDEQFLRAEGASQWPDGTVAARYSFLHTLYPEVLYERVTPGRRASLHRCIGEREEQAYGKRSREIAAELAVHFERGQDYGRAVQYSRRAGENAGRRLAYREAIQHLTKALELLKTLPDTPERSGQELTLQIALGMPLMATKGYAAPEVERVYARARELCRQIGETPQLFRVLHGLWGVYFVRAELQTARELGEQLLRLAQRVGDPMLLLHAHNALGSALCWMGEVALAGQHLAQGAAFSHSQRPSPSAFVQDPGVLCLGFLAWTLWSLGYPDRTFTRGHEALALAQELAHPFSLAFALNFAAEFHQLRREGPAAQARAGEVIALSREHGFLQWAMEATITHGWALTEQGQITEGIAQIRQGLVARRTAGAELGRPYHLALLTEAYAKAGQVEAGLQSLAEALELVDTTSEHFYEAELYRLKGELTLAPSSVQRLASRVQNPRSAIHHPQSEAEAEACFQKAIDLARRQQAKSLELRAVMSLARLWQQQGKTSGAHQMLAEIYGWFTEGFDTADLKEARVLLDHFP